MMTRPVKNARPDLRLKTGGFTLVELMIVMVIMAVMLSVVAPRSSRSDVALEVKQDSLDLVTLLRYAIDLADSTGRSVRLMLDINQRTYHLEMATVDDPTDFQPVPGFLGRPRQLSDHVRVEVQGLIADGYVETLVFDPQTTWPDAAEIFLLSYELEVRIVVQGRSLTVISSDDEAYGD